MAVMVTYQQRCSYFVKIWLGVLCLGLNIHEVTLKTTLDTTFISQCNSGKCFQTASVSSAAPVRSKLECGTFCASSSECTGLSWTLDESDEEYLCSIYNDVSSSCSISEACIEGDYIKLIEPSCLNGGTQIGDTCYCQPDYTGISCEIDMCPVEICDNYCFNYGTCSCSAGQQSCTCVAGFSGTNCENEIGPVPSPIILEVNNGFYAGTWGTMDYCDTATYVHGFIQRVDNSHDFTDATSVNAVKLYCSHPISEEMSEATPTSTVSEYGEWEANTMCQRNYYIVQFQMFAQPSGHYSNDDSATNNIRARCRGPGLSGTDMHIIEGIGFSHGGVWGDWSVTCGAGTAVCGIQTKVEPDQGFVGDDSALGDLKLQCCEF